MNRGEWYVICHNLRSRENVGSIFRTGDAFGISKIFLTGYTPAPPHPKISKTALGAEQWVPWGQSPSITRMLNGLKQRKVHIVALERTRQNISLRSFRPRFPLALILGNEVSGLSQRVLKRADSVVAIPMQGRKESLNVAVAFGIAAYHIRNKNRKA